MAQLLEVNNLVTKFYTEDGIVHAVNGISYTLAEGEAIAIVGESGSGKSVGVLSIMGLIPSPPGQVEAGSIIFNGRDLLQLSDEEKRQIRAGRNHRPWALRQRPHHRHVLRRRQGSSAARHGTRRQLQGYQRLGYGRYLRQHRRLQGRLLRLRFRSHLDGCQPRCGDGQGNRSAVADGRRAHRQPDRGQATAGATGLQPVPRALPGQRRPLLRRGREIHFGVPRSDRPPLSRAWRVDDERTPSLPEPGKLSA